MIESDPNRGSKESIKRESLHMRPADDDGGHFEEGLASGTGEEEDCGRHRDADGGCGDDFDGRDASSLTSVLFVSGEPSHGGPRLMN